MGRSDVKTVMVEIALIKRYPDGSIVRVSMKLL